MPGVARSTGQSPRSCRHGATVPFSSGMSLQAHRRRSCTSKTTRKCTCSLHKTMSPSAWPGRKTVEAPHQVLPTQLPYVLCNKAGLGENHPACVPHQYRTSFRPNPGIGGWGNNTTNKTYLWHRGWAADCLSPPPTANRSTTRCHLFPHRAPNCSEPN